MLRHFLYDLIEGEREYRRAEPTRNKSCRGQSQLSEHTFQDCEIFARPHDQDTNPRPCPGDVAVRVARHVRIVGELKPCIALGTDLSKFPGPARTQAQPAPSPQPGDAEATPPPPESTLGAEYELLVAARAALAEEEPGRSLALAELHRRDFPGGVLREERDSLRITALCQLGRDPEAHRLAGELALRLEEPAARRRLTAACGAPSR